MTMPEFVKRHAGLVVLLVVVAGLPLILPNRFYYDMATKVWLNAIVCVGLNLLVGYAGQISLAMPGSSRSAPTRRRSSRGGSRFRGSPRC